MAFSDKVINGSDVLLRVNGEMIACATSHTIELTNATREVSCKGSGDFTSAEYGKFSWMVSTDALLNLGMDEDSYIDYSSLMDIMLNKQLIDIISFTEEGNDALVVQGQGIITSISQVNPDSDNASYSVSIQGRGDIEVLNGIRAGIPTAITAIEGSGSLTLNWSDAPSSDGVDVRWAKVSDGDKNWTTQSVAAGLQTLTINGLDVEEYKISLRSLPDDSTTQVVSKWTSYIKATPLA